MGFLGFTWADAGSFAGGLIGAAVLGPPGAMLGSTAGSFLGGVVGDDRDAGSAAEEALVAGIGAAGGAWAANLGGKLLKDGITAAATRALSAGAARRVETGAAKTLLPWNKYEGSLLGALGGGFGGYEVSPQARPPVAIETIDIGNGSCPVEMARLRMPPDLSRPIADSYRQLPGYLCDVWRKFGSGSHRTAPVPEPPAPIDENARSGIKEYAAKAQSLNLAMAGFATLDRKVAALVREGAGTTEQGRNAVSTVIGNANRAAAEAPSGNADLHALDLLDDAFTAGNQILTQAITATDGTANRTDRLTAELRKLRAELDEHRAAHRRPVATGPSRHASEPPRPGPSQPAPGRSHAAPERSRTALEPSWSASGPSRPWKAADRSDARVTSSIDNSTIGSLIVIAPSAGSTVVVDPAIGSPLIDGRHTPMPAPPPPPPPAAPPPPRPSPVIEPSISVPPSSAPVPPPVPQPRARDPLRESSNTGTTSLSRELVSPETPWTDPSRHGTRPPGMHVPWEPSPRTPWTPAVPSVMPGVSHVAQWASVGGERPTPGA
ncbi:hypothetical protein [Nocardia cyriacigeorgica]|uniref:hypothetical protein n=1 Tax=Nocardia cyriacigeorgica TaxID=135487 RepID=UPI0024544F6B|nr:hypothetical protein [Nocardia cyriacigeorgica]